MLRLAIAFAFLLLISCKKDNDHRNSVLGKWELVETFDANTAWGGCNCWKGVGQTIGHIVEFKSNGTYEYTPTNVPPSVFLPGCTGTYDRNSDSTLVWNRCGFNDWTAKISHEGLFLLLEEHQFAGYIIYKYKRIR